MGNLKVSELLTADQLQMEEIVISLLVAVAFGVFIFVINKLLSKKELYSANFGVALIAVSIITDTIIIAIQNSLVISLGMVGALSIVRFRTAVKEPLDLVYLFWSISMGIVSGSGLYYLGIITSLILAITMLIFKNIPMFFHQTVLSITYSDIDDGKEIYEVIKKNTKKAIKKSQSIKHNSVSCIYEITTKDIDNLMKELNDMSAVEYVSAVDSANIIA